MYTGLTGKLFIDGKEIAYISNWSIETTTDMIEITQLGKTNKEKMPGLQGWSASADGVVSFLDDYKQNTLFAAKKAGNKVECIFYLIYSTVVANSVFFKGYGYIESLSVDLSAEDKGNISISISGTGELTTPVDTVTKKPA